MKQNTEGCKSRYSFTLYNSYNCTPTFAPLCMYPSFLHMWFTGV